MFKQKMMIATMVGACSLLAPLAQANAADDAPKQSAGTFAGDTLITTKVKAALLKEQTTQSLSIKVKTVNGVVELSGLADDAAQIDSAVQISRGVKDVKDVKNSLQLKKQPEK